MAIEQNAHHAPRQTAATAAVAAEQTKAVVNAADSLLDLALFILSDSGGVVFEYLSSAAAVAVAATATEDACCRWSVNFALYFTSFPLTRVLEHRIGFVLVSFTASAPPRF